jgi:hypothetical protein
LRFVKLGDLKIGAEHSRKAQYDQTEKDLEFIKSGQVTETRGVPISVVGY